MAYYQKLIMVRAVGYSDPRRTSKMESFWENN